MQKPREQGEKVEQLESQWSENNGCYLLPCRLWLELCKESARLDDPGCCCTHLHNSCHASKSILPSTYIFYIFALCLCAECCHVHNMLCRCFSLFPSGHGPAAVLFDRGSQWPVAAVWLIRLKLEAAGSMSNLRARRCGKWKERETKKKPARGGGGQPKGMGRRRRRGWWSPPKRERDTRSSGYVSEK